MFKGSVLKIARKNLLLSFQYDFNNPYQLPKPKRRSYSQADKGFIIIVFNLKLTLKFTTWKDKSKPKCHIPHLSLVFTALLSEFISHACCSVFQIPMLMEDLHNSSTFLLSFACSKSQPWSNPDFWDQGTKDKDLTMRTFSTLTSVEFLP